MVWAFNSSFKKFKGYGAFNSFLYHSVISPFPKYISK